MIDYLRAQDRVAAIVQKGDPLWKRRDIKDTLPPNEGARKLLKIAASHLSCSVLQVLQNYENHGVPKIPVWLPSKIPASLQSWEAKNLPSLCDSPWHKQEFLKLPSAMWCLKCLLKSKLLNKATVVIFQNVFSRFLIKFKHVSKCGGWTDVLGKVLCLDGPWCYWSVFRILGSTDPLFGTAQACCRGLKHNWSYQAV